MPLGDKHYYAYADVGGITYRSATSGSIGKVAAFMMGLPNELDKYLLALVLICVPVSFFAPIIVSFLRKQESKKLNGFRVRHGMTMPALWRRCLCVLLAYLILINPTWFQSVAYASSQYSQISTSDWATNKYIEYTYDDNGSCITKTIKNASSTPVESVHYDYNLRNKLERVIREYTPGSDDIDEVTEYTYNDDGIRVKSYYYKTVNNGSRQDEETKTFLIDAYNHTGYAQVLEEYDGTARTTYTIGDDIISQATERLC